MSHNITATDELFSVRQTPWHGLGEVWDDYPTREQAQKTVHPWEPVEAPVFKRVPVISEDGSSLTHEYVEIEGNKLIERSDNGSTLGVVSDSFGIVTNNELWDISEAVGSTGSDIMYETGGSLEGGKKVWILMRLEEPLEIKGDPNGATLAFLALQNGHTGLSSLRAQAINTRIVCANTSAAADLESKNSGYEFKFNHSAKITERLEDAKAAVAMWREGITVWQNAMESLVEQRVTAEGVKMFVEQFQPMPPNHLITDRVRGNIEEARSELYGILGGETTEGVADSAYGLFQAGIEWAQHYRGVKGKDERARMESYFKRSVMDNTGLRNSTLRLAQDVAKEYALV